MGPVIPLTATGKDKDKDSDKLLGAAGSSPTLGDAIATKVLAKGEPIGAPPGRADNFALTFQKPPVGNCGRLCF
jgi:hypothetical protein